MTWETLSSAQLYQLFNWLSFAEHHALRQYASADGVTCRNAWGIEVRHINHTQSDVLALLDRRRFSAVRTEVV